MNKRTPLVGVAVMALLLALTATVVAADSGPTSIWEAQPLSAAPVQATLAPMQSHWYTFAVPLEYSVEQMKRDQRRGATITPQRITLTFNDANHPDVAHNTGFRLYDLDRANRLKNNVELETKRDEFGMPIRDAEGNRIFEPQHWAIGSPEPRPGDKKAIQDNESIDFFIGRPKVWEGILHSPGVYYIEVFNASFLPMTYSLTISGPNLSLAP